MFGQFIWRHISDDWLVSRTASNLFLLSTAIVLTLTIALSGDFVPDSSLWLQLFWGIAGITGSVSAFFIWGGMYRHWMRYYHSDPFIRKVWFLFLLIGLWYGAILYFGFVYLPAFKTNDLRQNKPQQ